MRASRLLAILITLQARGRVAASELAQQFEVSRRTIYRDVDELSAAGVPVYAERGVNGGFQLAESWSSQLGAMTPAELDALVFAGMPGQAAELGIGTDAATARLKLMATTSTHSSGEAPRIAERFHFDATPWHRRPLAPVPHLRTVAQAVWEARCLRIRYASWQKESTKTVEPLGLVLKAGVWYFVSIQRVRVAIFKVENIRSAEVLDERFRRPARFDLVRAWSQSVLGFERSLQSASALLWVAPTAMARIERLGPMMADPIRAAAADPDGFRRVEVAIESISQAADAVLGFGDGIEVREPTVLRSELAQRAMRLSRLYAAKLPPS